MNKGKIVCFVEEKSAKEMLKVIIPKLTKMDEKYIRCIPFRGKQDLQNRIKKSLINYKDPNCVFLVMCDQDLGDCKKLRSDLLRQVEDKTEKTKIRIACRELESFYLGDLQAVGEALELPNLWKMQDKIKYRTPDDCVKPSKLLQEITKEKYKKVAGSRSIAPHLRLDGSNKSHSFNMLVSAIEELSAMLPQNGTT